MRLVTEVEMVLIADEELSTSHSAAEPDYIEMKGIRLSGTPLYLDMQATTPLDPRVLDAMLPYMIDKYGNPHSRTHAYGWETEDSVEIARKQVMVLLQEQSQDSLLCGNSH